MAEVDFTEPRWRFEERVQNLIKKGRTRQEAEEIVKYVITTKEVNSGKTYKLVLSGEVGSEGSAG